ncbi:MAG: hypothetical protein NTY46_16145 [Candidatus Sumerlaeota bacterium]|nr:hypothetical protein [Candidatus Sumerlaeota bacterium]
MLTNTQKDELWHAYHEHRPTRIPVMLRTNPRIIVLDAQLNHNGYKFEQVQTDACAHVEISLQHAHYVRTVLNQFTDGPAGLPDCWEVYYYCYNIYEAAAFGAEVCYPPDQVPCTEPFLTEANKREIFDCDIEHPFENRFIKQSLAFWREMERICADMRYEGRPVRLMPFALTGTDGPFTAGCNLRGADFLLDFMEDADYAARLMELVTRAATIRRRTFERYWGNRIATGNWLADDSCAMISVPMYRERVMPYHRQYYDAAGGDIPRWMHLCGDATHLFPVMKNELGVSSFDTGFPVNHGELRRSLGPDVEIAGGPEAGLLLNGTPDDVWNRTRDILLSGVKSGGRFILAEGNNLPPACPPDNLKAMYASCLEFGFCE